MKINLSKLDYKFHQKPILIGGCAMEFYNLRKSGQDIDIIACKKDIKKLLKKYPKNIKNMYGDFGIIVNNIEIWKTIWYFNYDDLKYGAIETKNFYVISLEKLLYLKSLVKNKLNKAKNIKDVKLIVLKAQSIQEKKYNQIREENKKIIKKIKNFKYCESQDRNTKPQKNFLNQIKNIQRLISIKKH